MLEKFRENKLVAVIRSKNSEKAKKMIDAALEGGFKILEITFTIPDVANVFEYIQKIKNSKKYDFIYGAGTVLTESEALEAAKYKCDFMVSPNLSPEFTGQNASKYPFYIPGVLTPNDIGFAIKNGCNFLKLFPGNLINFGYIKSLKGPFPKVDFMVTGGVDVNNINEWLKSGAISLGVGGNLTIDIEENDDYEKCVKKCTDFVMGIHEWKY